MLLLCDHVITLDKEVEWIWTFVKRTESLWLCPDPYLRLRWRPPKIIFIINRYALTPMLLLESIPHLISPLPISFCNVYYYLRIWMPLLSFCTVELLIIIRVCSLYGNRKLLVWSLCGLMIFALVGWIVTLIPTFHNFQTFLFYESLPGCWVSTGPDNGWQVWAIFVSVEGVLMLLTAYKLLSYRNQMNRTITVLARDSIVYFIIIFACLVLNLTINTDISIPIRCITSIAVGRMMMNIRGLIMGDPEYTVHLQTLQFAARTNPDSDIELRVVRTGSYPGRV